MWFWWDEVIIAERFIRRLEEKVCPWGKCLGGKRKEKNNRKMSMWSTVFPKFNE